MFAYIIKRFMEFYYAMKCESSIQGHGTYTIYALISIGLNSLAKWEVPGSASKSHRCTRRHFVGVHLNLINASAGSSHAPIKFVITS